MMWSRPQWWVALVITTTVGCRQLLGLDDPPLDAPIDAPPSPFAQRAYIKASNAGSNDSFGYSVALSADGSTLAVGAYGEASVATGIDGNQMDEAAPGAGAVYVFTRSGATWTQEAYLKASNTGTSDSFGASVALSADGSTLAVGAATEDSIATGIGGNQADNSASGSGAVYVFTRSGISWTQQAYVKASNTDAADQFGFSVALSADGSTLAVGAYLEDSGTIGGQSDNSAADAGAVYLFTRIGTAWAQQAYFKASNAEAADRFGFSVALSDNGSTLAVGACLEDSRTSGVGGDPTDNSALDAGAVYVFTRAGSSWTQQAYLKASNTGAVDQFGISVALSADGSTLAVGAYGEDAAINVGGDQGDESASDSGAVYVLTRAGTTWSQEAYVKASNTDAFDQFGVRVALSADGTTLAIGAAGEDSAATGIDGNQADNTVTNAGAVYLFSRAATTWTRRAYVKASNTGVTEQNLYNVALSADGSTLAAGAHAEDSAAIGIDGNQADTSAANAGAVYVFQ